MNPHDGEPGPSTGPSTDPSAVGAEAAPAEPLDLERIGHDLDGVETALRRLDEGTYWTDEVSGQPIPDEVLAVDPVARRSEA